ncbi:MAG TPA: MMPL family transporter [Methylomirabilota bacterium]|jgi:predicted RND superfamily exporter protein|nr:MMPL family transporter [Methylomirabilota bacterium]
MRWVSHLIVSRPKLILFVIFLLTGFFADHARRIRLDSSVDSLLPKEDPEKTYYDEIRQQFGSDEIGVIGVIADNIYTPEALQKIKRLTDAIRQFPEVKNVISLTSAPDVITSVARESARLVPDVNATHAALEEIKRKLTEQPVYLKNLVSADGRAAAINIFFENLGDDEFFRRGVDDRIQALIEQENHSGPAKLYYTGLPHFKVHSTRAMWEDLSLFVPLTLALIIVILFLSFRSLRGVVLPTLTVVVSLLWTLGIMTLAGSSLSLGNMALPPLVLVLGTAYSLHVVAEYYELARPGRSVRDVVVETLHTTTTPLFIAALTTVIGFLSLIVNSIVSIRELGLYASFGISIAFLLSVVFVPACLMLLSLPTTQAEAFSPRIGAVLRTLAMLSSRHRRFVIAVGLLVAGVSVWQSAAIQVGSDFQSFFRETDPIRQATDVINRALVGSMTFYVVVEGEEKDIVKKWDTLWRIKNLQLYIDSLPGVEKTVSFVDYCELLDRGIQEIPLEPPEGEIVEPAPPEIKTTFWANPEQLKGVMRLVFLNAESIASVVNHPNYTRTTILVRTSLSRSNDIAALVEQIDAFARSHFPPELRVHPTGNLILLTRTTGDIVSGQIQSLALSASIIFVLMAVMFLSARVGLIAMVPNVFPLFVFFGLMGVTGAELNFGTNIIASIALGVAVDDTIHIMTRLSSTVRTTTSQEQALLETLSTVGKPALYASLVLCLGFLTLGFSTFVPIREFGFLSAVTIVVGLIGEIALLPALLATTPIITLWDLLYVKLGKDPHKTIGLFANLRPSQAKIVALMGELKSFPRGQAIIRPGDMSNAMYVMISGRAEVRVNSAGHSHSLWEVQRGDVFGVTGLIGSEERVSEVVALEDVEVLAMDERFRTRVWRYPRIAARVFFNLSTMLLDRLQYTIQRAPGRQGDQRAQAR